MKRLLAISILLAAGVASAQYKSEAEVAKSFVRILQNADTAALLGMMPPVSVYRMTSPDETQGKTDEEVLEMSKPLRDEMVMGFQYLLREADSLGIDRSKLKVIGQKTNDIAGYGGFYGLIISFTYGKKQGQFSIGTAFINDVWYVYAIDQMIGCFTEMVNIKGKK